MIKCSHNNRCRYETFFHCKDCDVVIKQGSLEYFIEEGISGIAFSLHNRANKDKLALELDSLREEMWKFMLDRDSLRLLKEKEQEELMKRTYTILDKYRVSDKEGSLTLKG